MGVSTATEWQATKSLLAPRDCVVVSRAFGVEQCSLSKPRSSGTPQPWHPSGTNLASRSIPIAAQNELTLPTSFEQTGHRRSIQRCAADASRCQREPSQPVDNHYLGQDQAIGIT